MNHILKHAIASLLPSLFAMTAVASSSASAVSAELNTSEGGSAATELQAILNSLQSFSARFEQVMTEEDGYVLDEQTGIMYFAQPGKIRWESEQPFAQTLVADGEHIYFYDPDLNQVTIRDWSDDPAVNPATVFVGGLQISDHFQVGKSDTSFRLSPLAKGSSLVELEIVFEENLPQKMRLLDTLGQTTEVTFSDGSSEFERTDELFSFEIPLGAEVIKDSLSGDG